jgi:hypothetical protein
MHGLTPPLRRSSVDKGSCQMTCSCQQRSCTLIKNVSVSEPRLSPGSAMGVYGRIMAVPPSLGWTRMRTCWPSSTLGHVDSGLQGRKSIFSEDSISHNKKQQLTISRVEV